MAAANVAVSDTNRIRRANVVVRSIDPYLTKTLSLTGTLAFVVGNDLSPGAGVEAAMVGG